MRVFQSFATIDLLSQGRAEIVAGRGSFIESFPLFGLRLEDYDSLFADAEYVESNLIRGLDLFDQVAKAHRCADRTTGVVMRGGEAVDADLHLTLGRKGKTI